ncbi:MAG: hypothetical protein AB1792_03225 [Candidatus Zixiibacteriota bacterium]
MDTAELDRLEQSIRRAMERIGSLEASNQRLSEEKTRLERRLKDRAVPTPRTDPPPTLSPDRLAEVKVRLQRLIESVRECERRL